MSTPTVSTLWDYIHRAMPWDNPRSLEPDEVYAALAYLLSLAEIVDFDFTLSDENIAEVQERMPNRNGTVLWEDLWYVDGTPDTNNTACMKDCVESVEISSVMPEKSRNAHGDIAAQNRIVGPVRGVNTLEPELEGSVEDNAQNVKEHARSTLEESMKSGSDGDNLAQAATDVLNENGCMACHARDTKKVGPSFVEVAKKYDGEDDAHAYLTKKIKEGGSGVWGSTPMPANPNIKDDDIQHVVDWLLA